MEQGPSFLKKLEKNDAEYANLIKTMIEKENKDTALPAKIKALIIMALDASRGLNMGVKALAEQARKNGATEQEILETIELVGDTCGIQGLISALNAIKEE
jgi:alkylhydroperoxidase/carboxymuconolactone decarboxylase family protein YurZ